MCKVWNDKMELEGQQPNGMEETYEGWSASSMKWYDENKDRLGEIGQKLQERMAEIEGQQSLVQRIRNKLGI